MSAIIDSDIVIVEIDAKGQMKAQMRVEQVAELWLAIRKLQAASPEQAKLLGADGETAFEEAEEDGAGQHGITTAQCHEWIRAHPGVWFTNVDIVMGVLDVPRELAEQMLSGRTAGGRSRHVSVNGRIRDALQALPPDWKREEYQPGQTSPKYRCVARPGQSIPPRPGTLDGVAP